MSKKPSKKGPNLLKIGLRHFYCLNKDRYDARNQTILMIGHKKKITLTNLMTYIEPTLRICGKK